MITDEMLLVAITRCPTPDTAYIADFLMRSFGMRFAPGVILSKLKALQAKGLVTRSQHARGSYGYHWTITTDMDAERKVMPSDSG